MEEYDFMKGFKKILICLVLLIVSVGVAYAVDADDFKYPDTLTYENSDEGFYFDENGVGMMLVEYNDITKDFYLTEHDDYSVQERDNVYAFIDEGTARMGGMLEVIEFNGEKFIVVSSTILDKLNDERRDAIVDNLIEFNELNDVEPISV